MDEVISRFNDGQIWGCAGDDDEWWLAALQRLVKVRQCAAPQSSLSEQGVGRADCGARAL